MNHATETVGRKIVIHGGWNGSDLFNDLWIFNTDSFAWIQPKTAGFGPTPRFGHSINLLHDGRVIMYGGCSVNRETGVPKYLNDVRQLDTESMLWTRPRISGNVPTARYGHGARVVSGHNLIVCGGWGTLGVQSSDEINNPDAHVMHCLDSTTMTWRVVNLAGRKPLRALYNHSIAVSGTTLYIHGGFDGKQASFDYFEVDLISDATQTAGSEPI